MVNWSCYFKITSKRTCLVNAAVNVYCVMYVLLFCSVKMYSKCFMVVMWLLLLLFVFLFDGCRPGKFADGLSFATRLLFRVCDL